jgi:PPM family protein phosphatase
VFLVRQGNVYRLTEDHTLVAIQLRAGAITPEDAKRSRLKNILTRTIGSHESVQVDTLLCDLLPDDVLLMCSDGVHMYLEDPIIARLVGTTRQEALASTFVAHANSQGGADNASAITIRASAPQNAATLDTVARIDAVRTMFLFRHLVYKEQAAVLSIATTHHFKPGEVIVREGAPGKELFVVVKGKVAVAG